MVNTKNPIAQTARVIKVSGKVGQYSVILSKGLGTNPPTTKPNPLSIHKEINTEIEASANRLSFFLIFGKINKTRATTASILESHIIGTSLLCPSNPV